MTTTFPASTPEFVISNLKTEPADPPKDPEEDRWTIPSPATALDIDQSWMDLLGSDDPRDALDCPSDALLLQTLATLRDVRQEPVAAE